MRRISDDECRVMGFNPIYAHPAWMVLTVLPVPPPAVRPSVAVDSNARCSFQQACAFVSSQCCMQSMKQACLAVPAMPLHDSNCMTITVFQSAELLYLQILLVLGSNGQAGHRSEDDLTHKLAEIIKANNKLRRQDQNGAPQHIIREFSQLLQFHITTYFDNTKPGQPVAAQVLR